MFSSLRLLKTLVCEKNTSQLWKDLLQAPKGTVYYNLVENYIVSSKKDLLTLTYECLNLHSFCPEDFSPSNGSCLGCTRM